MQRHRASIGTGGWQVDVPNNKVGIYVDNLDPALAAELARALPAGTYEVHIGFNLRPTHTGRFEYPPYDAGLILDVGTGRCTSGFTTLNSASGVYYGTTAGHCGPWEAQWRLA